MQQQQRQQRALLGASERNRLRPVANLERA